jgi:hypothetical protein
MLCIYGEEEMETNEAKKANSYSYFSHAHKPTDFFTDGIVQSP